MAGEQVRYFGMCTLMFAMFSGTVTVCSALESVRGWLTGEVLVSGC